MDNLFVWDPKYEHLLRMPEGMLPPESLYRFKPDCIPIPPIFIVDLDVFSGTDRLIFGGGVKYTSEEIAGLQGFFKYMREKKLRLPNNADMPLILRFLRSLKYNNEETFDTLSKYFKWRSAKLPIKVTDKLVDIINTGFIYVHGRDRNYRPVIMIHPGRILGDADSAEKIAEVCVFIFEHIIHYMFVPGKLENWVTIIDLENTGITDIPRAAMKDMIDCLQNAYKGRLCKMFVVNANFVIRILWGIAETFMDPNTKAKICLSSSPDPKELKECVHPGQLLKKYGGEAELPKQFWPPVFPSGPTRDEFETKHLRMEEFKKELIEKPQTMPSPELAEFVRGARHAKCKKGVFERKTFALPTRFERRNSFNGIINPPAVEVVEENKIELKPAVVQTKEPVEVKVKEVILPKATLEPIAPVASKFQEDRPKPIVQEIAEQKQCQNAQEDNTGGSSGRGSSEPGKEKAEVASASQNSGKTKTVEGKNSKAACGCVIL